MKKSLFAFTLAFALCGGTFQAEAASKTLSSYINKQIEAGKSVEEIAALIANNPSLQKSGQVAKAIAKLAKRFPAQAANIVTAAIKANPSVAKQITKAVVAAVPSQAKAVKAAAVATGQVSEQEANETSDAEEAETETPTPQVITAPAVGNSGAGQTSSDSEDEASN